MAIFICYWIILPSFFFKDRGNVCLYICGEDLKRGKNCCWENVLEKRRGDVISGAAGEWGLCQGPAGFSVERGEKAERVGARAGSWHA